MPKLTQQVNITRLCSRYEFEIALPGEILPKVRPVVFELGSRNRRIKVKTPPPQIRAWRGPHFSWLPDNEHFYYTDAGRGKKYIELREMHRETAKPYSSQPLSGRRRMVRG